LVDHLSSLHALRGLLDKGMPSLKVPGESSHRTLEESVIALSTAPLASRPGSRVAA
jgi:hypothetical protein